MDDHKAYLLKEFKALKAEIAVLLRGRMDQPAMGRCGFRRAFHLDSERLHRLP
ncbi:hypothetical protein [Teichococcus aestuarii]|uniref:hypothetical protein n=1 Tax=Teichococcus aestuarii TaxID=568898 RepID=UPI0015E828B7|nr:hypothetical protein [Pseudoroseomonas aestuarii]